MMQQQQMAEMAQQATPQMTAAMAKQMEQENV